MSSRYGVDMSPEGPTQKRKRRWGIIAVIVVALLALLAGIGGWYLGVGRFTTTPEITGLTVNEATTAVQDKGLSLEVVSQQYSETMPAGQIISSVPQGGDRIHNGDTVKVVVSKGKQRFEVPNVLGDSEDDARAALAKANIGVGEVTQEHNGKYDEGTVADMSIDPKTEVRPGTTVDLTISTGPVPIRVPDVVGSFAGQAKGVLEELGFQVNFAPETTEDTAPNRVTAQDPEDGTTGHKGDVITLTISKPAVEVPSVFGSELQDARRTLHDAGLKVEVQRADQYTGFNRVGAQDPAPGETVSWGSTVTITIF